MKAVDAVIRSRLNSEVVLIRTIGDYIIGAGAHAPGHGADGGARAGL